MGYEAVNVARYVVNLSQDLGYPVSNLKLQKVLYFLQGFFLALYGKECFKEEIEAWGFGPVVPEVYREFKEYGSNNIPKIEKYFVFNENIFDSCYKEFDDSFLKKEDKKLIEIVVDLLKKYSASSLVKMTHENGGPWKKCYISGQKHLKIEKEDIKKYFKERYLDEKK